jgi:hypothetical protein
MTFVLGQEVSFLLTDVVSDGNQSMREAWMGFGLFFFAERTQRG